MDEKNHSQGYVRREKMDEVRDYLESIIAHTPGHIYWKDLNCRFLGCNDLQAETVGLPSRQAIVGLSSLDIISKNQPEKERLKQAKIIDQVDKQVMATNQAITIEEPLILEDGSQQVFLSQKVPLRNSENEVIGILGISLDITEQKEAEKQILLAKERAEAANKAKETFLENMRHDLRTPFTGILTLATLMAKSETDDEKHENLECIAESATVLLEYMNEILDNATVGTSTQPKIYQKIHLEQLLSNALATIKPVAETKDIKLNVKCPASIPHVLLIDKFKLQRILINLLGNAAKFTDNGAIEVSVETINESEDTITLDISISDTGIGIPKEKLGYIFERFAKLEDSSTNKYQGIGLGLNDVRELCAQLDGKITVKENIPNGSVFTVSIPFKKSKTEEKITPEKLEKKQDSSESTHQAKILLVEDHPIAAMAAEKLLKSYGHSVTIATSGSEAIEIFKEKGQFDFILMDIGLPDITGFETTQRILEIEQKEKLSHTPIIALTAHQDGNDGKMKVFDAVHIKPILPDAIEAITAKFYLQG